MLQPVRVLTLLLGTMAFSACLTSGEAPVAPTVPDVPRPLPGPRDSASTVQPPAANAFVRLLPAQLEVDAGAQLITITVQAARGVTWRVEATTPSWISIASAAFGVGDGSMTVLIADNPGSRRGGVIRVGDAEFSVAQRAATPGSVGDSTRRLVFRPESLDLDDSASSTSLAIKASGSAAWTLRLGDPASAVWIQLPFDASGRGSLERVLRVSTNVGAMRGALVQGLTDDGAEAWLLVRQAGHDGRWPVPDPRVQLDAHTLEFAAAGGTLSLHVGAPADHCWNIGAPTTDWLTVAGAQRRCGAESVVVRTTPNIARSRGIVLFIGDHTVRLVQRGTALAP
jgi:hypothetical protein